MMNTRALALGVVIGFVVAFAPSCGGGKCGPNNCGGCCDDKGKCVAKPNNANNTTCGSAGNLCADCSTSGTACNPNTFTCGTGGGGGAGGGVGGGGMGGGVGGGGGGGTCDGCRLPNGTCVPLSATSVNNCGTGGAQCQACPSGQLCTNGVCNTPMTMKKIGDPCTTDQECGTIPNLPMGAQIICKKMTSTGNGTYTGGYCTARCGSGTPVANNCPAGSMCVGVDPRYGETDVFCWDRCGAGDPCRTPGYACYGVGGGSACWLNPIPQQDAGPPADKIGNACTADMQCANPPDRGGSCYGVADSTNDFDNRSALGFIWPGGYCSKDFCDSDSECSTDGGAKCITFNINGNSESRCMRHCSQGGSALDAGQSDCRTDYRCFALGLPDAGRTTDGICLGPVAPEPARTGQSCNTSADCQVPAGAVADCLPSTQQDGGPSPFTGGYCTRFECADETECGRNAADAGNMCLVISAQGNTSCFESCPAGGAGQGTCRTGYVCQSYTQGDGGASPDGYCNPNCNNVPGSCGTRTCNATTGYCQ